MYNSEYNYIELSPSLLMQKLHMSNKNFTYGRNNINKFSRWLEIPIETIYDFYNSTYKKNKDIIESSLNRFKRKSLIDYDKDVVKVCTIDREYRRAIDREREYIKEIEQKVFEEIGYEDKKDIFLHGEWNSFRDKKSNYLKDIDIIYDFNVYHIITTRKFRSMILEEKEYSEISNKLNLDIQNSAEKSAIIRHKNTIDKYTTHASIGKDMFFTPIWDKEKNRTTNKYIDDTKKVIAMCIDKFNTLDLNKLLCNISSEKYTFLEDVMNEKQWVQYCNSQDLNDLFS